ncbi:hypothetical protein [Clostridium hydrogenum]|nr:hypothetical protein [Clostridium hydrogenum]
MLNKNEKLTDEQLLNMTGGQAFLDKCEVNANFNPPINPLYDIPPII